MTSRVDLPMGGSTLVTRLLRPTCRETTATTWASSLRSLPLSPCSRHAFDRSKARRNGDRFVAMARSANADEKHSLWSLLADRYPFSNDYLKETDRDIPLVVLERTEG